MNTHEFTLTIDRDPDEETTDALYAAGLADAMIEGGHGTGMVHVARYSTSLAEAMLSAVLQIESVGLAVTGVQSDDLVSLKDIADRYTRTYESVRLLAAGKRGPGGFPPPMSSGQWALYSWTAVAAWFHEHYGTPAVTHHDREIAAADHLIRARRILANNEHRTEMAQLLDA